MSRFQSFPVAELPVGIRLGCAVYDEHNTKLLAAGLAISDQLVQALHRREVTSVLVSTTDIGRMQAFRPQGQSKHPLPDREIDIAPTENDFSREMDQNLNAWLRPAADRVGPKFSDRVKKILDGTYDEEWVEHLATAHELQVTQLEQVGRSVVRGGSEQVLALTEGCAEVIDRILNDVDAFTCLGGNPNGGEYPGRHCLHTAMLAISIGTSFGCDHEQLRNLTIGCLMHDLAMLEVDQYTLKSRKVLDANEFREITKHPVRIFDLLETHLDHVPEAARMVAYQMHERFDGSGYPRQRQGCEIHLLARIAAVADSFVALVAPRPHRNGLLAYYAVAKLLKDASAGRFDPQIVRHLLQAVSLFPLGSYIELNDNRVARVLRTTPKYDRPVIEMWERGSVSAHGAVVDLSHEPDLRVMRPLPALR